MELTAICEALEALTGAIEVRTDSTYVEKCFNENWHERWLRDGAWKGSNGAVKNRDLWERLFGLVWDGGRAVTWVWIPGHAGDPNNHRVDRLARVAALSDALPDRFTVVEGVETRALARRRKPRRASLRELPAAEMSARLLETPRSPTGPGRTSRDSPARTAQPSFAGSYSARRSRARLGPGVRETTNRTSQSPANGRSDGDAAARGLSARAMAGGVDVMVGCRRGSLWRTFSGRPGTVATGGRCRCRS